MLINSLKLIWRLKKNLETIPNYRSTELQAIRS